MKQAHVLMNCEDAVESIRFFMEGELPAEAGRALQEHIRQCKNCRMEFNTRKNVLALLGQTYGEKKISEAFATGAKSKLTALRETSGAQPVAVGAQRRGSSSRLRPAARAAALEDSQENEAVAETASSSFMADRLGAAPWWVVSVMLHVLVIALAGLVSMAIELPPVDESMIIITELSPRLELKQVEEEKPKTDLKTALESRHETPPTDPTSKDASDIVVPPDILAKAELGDHFETINLDRPDTQSAFGNPDAHMFHSVQGNDEPEGGGGMGGAGLDELIGVGGNASPGSGGGWGGGHGTGIGVGNGAGRGSFGNRNGGGRKLMVKRHGGSKATENSVDIALEWLARHQEADGRWSLRNTEGRGEATKDWDPGITGLAVLAFLGAGHTEKVGKYRENVVRAIGWMISQQRADGAIGANPKWTEHHGGYGYHHAICGLALAEAAGMARVPDTKSAAQKAIDYTCNLYQYGEGSDKLGFRYAPKSAEGDVSVSGWFIMQLKSAKIAGLRVDAMSFDGALKFLASREHPAQAVLASPQHRGDEGYDSGRHRYGYTDRTVHVNTTAIGSLCQLFCGVKVDEVLGAATWLLRTNPPAWKADLGAANGGGWPMYYTYYTTLLMFQVGGDTWKTWNEAMKKMLIDNQRKDGDAAGSWDPLSEWEKNAGRAYTTALGALSLEVYYRYLKLDAH